MLIPRAEKLTLELIMHNIKNLGKYIDHTILKNTTSEKDIAQVCKEALSFDFAAVCVPPRFVQQCASVLKNTPIHIATVVGFPLGYASTAVKVYETTNAIYAGATEIDVVLSVNDLKQARYDQVHHELKQIKEACQEHCLKVIIETSELNFDDKVLACQVVEDAGADYIKTSTGFSSSGAQLEDIRLFKKILGQRVKIKASGGIRSAQDALRFIEAGAHRLGTSQSVKIIKQFSSQQ